jgi:Protein of unknown function (DUF4232)
MPQPSRAPASALSSSPSPRAEASPPRTATPASFDIEVDRDQEVVYAGERATFTVNGLTNDTSRPIGIAEATLAFGDGSISTEVGDCSLGPASIPVAHEFQAGGIFSVAVQAAHLCNDAPVGDVTPADILVWPAAPPESAAWPACSPSALAFSGVDKGSSLSNGGAIVSFRNISKHDCQLTGYPQLMLVGPDGAALRTALRDATTGAYLFPAIPVGRVALPPGASGSFQIAYGAVSGGPDAEKPPDYGCPHVTKLRVLMPGTAEYGIVRLDFSPCDGIVGVSAVFPGRDWIGFQ